MNRPLALVRLGALERWRSEIRAGWRKNDAAHFDNLHAAACNELAALEAQQRGDMGRARKFLDIAWLRLHGCYHDPDDRDPNDDRKPGPGGRMLTKLKADAAPAETSAPDLGKSVTPTNPWSALRPTYARGWAAR